MSCNKIILTEIPGKDLVENSSTQNGCSDIIKLGGKFPICQGANKIVHEVLCQDETGACSNEPYETGSSTINDSMVDEFGFITNDTTGKKDLYLRSKPEHHSFTTAQGIILNSETTLTDIGVPTDIHPFEPLEICNPCKRPVLLELIYNVDWFIELDPNTTIGISYGSDYDESGTYNFSIAGGEANCTSEISCHDYRQLFSVRMRTLPAQSCQIWNHKLVASLGAGSQGTAKVLGVRGGLRIIARTTKLTKAV